MPIRASVMRQARRERCTLVHGSACCGGNRWQSAGQLWHGRLARAQHAPVFQTSTPTFKRVLMHAG
eukprot:355922-Chlamydomonas_euryale.AAC.3